MKKTIFITGVTRMRGGYVCISGIDDQERFIRPQICYTDRTGIRKEYLYDGQGQAIIRPLAKVELDFLKPTPKSTFHTEDWEINGNFAPRLISIPDETERLSILNKHTNHSLEQVLSTQSRSLVIVRSQETPKIEIRIYQDRLKSHISFHDESGDYHRHLPVTDANWLAACKFLYRIDRQHTAQRLTNALQNKQIFIRIGITRKWEGQVWRQVSGIFTIPDWLDGKCFADFNYDFTDNI